MRRGCGRPCTRVMPWGWPESSLVAKLPSVHTTLRADQLHLCEEVPLAGLDLLGLRVAVPRRAALEHIGDVDVGPREPDRLEQPLEHLPGLADERRALLVLVEAGRLADEHQVGVRVARSDHDLGARGRESALDTASPLIRQSLELCRACWCVAHGSHSGKWPGRLGVSGRSRSFRRSIRHRRRRPSLPRGAASRTTTGASWPSHCRMPGQWTSPALDADTSSSNVSEQSAHRYS